mgnify:CR=1 FL=1
MVNGHSNKTAQEETKVIYPNQDGTITPSCYYDDAVGDVNAAIEKLESLKSRIEGDNSWTTRDEDDEDDRIGEIDEQIQNLQTMVDFDHQSLDRT